jgi:hypothetical protein
MFNTCIYKGLVVSHEMNFEWLAEVSVEIAGEEVAAAVHRRFEHLKKLLSIVSRTSTTLTRTLSRDRNFKNR